METLVSIIGVAVAIFAAVSGNKKKKDKNAKVKAQTMAAVSNIQKKYSQMTQSVYSNQPVRSNQQAHREQRNGMHTAAQPNTDAREDWQVARNLEIETTDLMRNVEKLMITGYDSELKFERDFIGEGVEMLNRCSVVENIVPLFNE